MSEHTANGEAFTELVLEVFRLNRLLHDAGDQLSAPVGLSTARWQVLGVVEHGPIPVADVARAMGLTRQSVRETAALLESEGFVEFVENPRHRRARLMRITHLGMAAMERLAVEQAAWANRLADALPLEELRAAARMMGRIRESLEPDPPLAEAGS